MITDTRKNILKYISTNEPINVVDIVNIFWLSKQIIHRHLKKLIEENKVYKVWKPPIVYYFANTGSDKDLNVDVFNNEEKELLKETFVYFGANWEVKYADLGFIKWCGKRNLDPIKEIIFYKRTLKKYSVYKNENKLINWKTKIQAAFWKIYLDELYYLDFYSIEKYWKTLLWNLMLYAKQTNNKDLANETLDLIKDRIYKIIKAYNIDSFAFIPPSIDRKIQLMNELKKWLDLEWKFNLKELKLIKIFRDKPVPQKSLNKKSDRIINASQTIFIWSKNFKWNNILLIDDAVGSWATLNETAKKIKSKKLVNKIYWLAIVWSYKWFEIINEV